MSKQTKPSHTPAHAGTPCDWLCDDYSPRKLIARAAQIDTRGARHPLIVFNSLSWADADIISIAAKSPRSPQSLRQVDGSLVSPIQKIKTPRGTRFLMRPTDVPALGHALFDLSEDASPYNPSDTVTAAISSGRTVIENQLLRVEIDAAGQITRLFDKSAQREVLPPGRPANTFIACADPSELPALIQHGSNLPGPAKIKLIESGPLRAALQVTHSLGSSKLIQRIMLQANSRRVDFQTDLDWRSKTTSLCAIHPVEIFWHPQRDTRAAGPHWIDLAEYGYGVAMLHTGHCGLATSGNVLVATLALKHAKPHRHSCTYSLYPHAGDFRAAGVIQQAHRLNNPLRAVTATSHPGPLPPHGGLLYIDAPNVIIESIKKSNSGRDLIIHLHEAYGQRGNVTITTATPFKKCTPVDSLERPTKLFTIQTESKTIRMHITPFAMHTLALAF